MQCYSYVAIIAVIVSLSYYFFEKWVTANPPVYSEGVPTTTGVLMLQGFAVRRRTEEKMNSIATAFLNPHNKDSNPTKGKTILLTGSTSGLGFGTATRLLAAGGFKKLILPCRKGNNEGYVGNFLARLSRAAKELVLSQHTTYRKNGLANIEHGLKNIVIVHLDLGSFKSIDDCIFQLKRKLLFSEEGDSTKTIDVLINNAGLVNIYGGRTKDGFEKAFGVNYLGTAYFTEEIMNANLFSTYDPVNEFPRVVMVTSEEHRLFNKIQLKNQSFFGDFYDFGLFSGGQMEGYAYSKFLLTTYSHELSRRWKNQVRVFDICPGPVSSNIAGDAPWPINELVILWMKYSFVSGVDAALPLFNVGFYKQDKTRIDDKTKPLIHFHMGEQRPASKESQYEAQGSILWSLTRKLFVNRKPFTP
jgi:NAD(P)-dependent dehydrogenase (short-subunit alcohol dehydrogenase family)